MSEWTVVTIHLNTTDADTVDANRNSVRAVCRDSLVAASACRGRRDDTLVARLKEWADGDSPNAAQTVDDILGIVADELVAAYTLRHDGVRGYAECDVHDETGARVETITGNTGENAVDVRAMMDARYDVEPYCECDIVRNLLADRYSEAYLSVESLDATLARLQELAASGADDTLIQTIVDRERDKLQDAVTYTAVSTADRDSITAKLTERDWESARALVNPYLERKPRDACRM